MTSIDQCPECSAWVAAASCCDAFSEGALFWCRGVPSHALVVVVDGERAWLEPCA